MTFRSRWWLLRHCDCELCKDKRTALLVSAVAVLWLVVVLVNVL